MGRKETGTKPRILIVEDDAASRGLMQILLGAYGECSFAENGLQGVELFAQALEDDQPFDLVCLDKEMNKLPLCRSTNAQWRGR